MTTSLQGVSGKHEGGGARVCGQHAAADVCERRHHYQGRPGDHLGGTHLWPALDRQRLHPMPGRGQRAVRRAKQGAIP